MAKSKSFITLTPKDWEKIAQFFKKLAKTVASQKIYIKAQFESLKHDHQTTLEKLKTIYFPYITIYNHIFSGGQQNYLEINENLQF